MEPARSSLISLAVIALSILAVVVASRLRPPPPPPPGELVEHVFRFPADAVSEVAVRSWQGELVAVKQAGAWQVRELTVAAGDDAGGGGEARATPSPELVDATISDLVKAIVGLPQIDRFPRAGQPLASFGLEKPQATVEMRLADGAEHGLVIGELTLTGSALYARVLPQDDIVQIGNPIFNDMGSAMFRLLGSKGSAPSP